MNEFEEQKKEVLEPIYFEAGAALFDCQAFEYDIAFLLFLLAMFDTKGLEVTRVEAILENEERKTAGQLIRLLQTHLKVSEGLEETLRDSLKARNELVHRCLIENVERFTDPNEREKLVMEIRSLRTRVQKSKKALAPFIKGLGEGLTGINFDDISEEVRNKFMLDTKHSNS